MNAYEITYKTSRRKTLTAIRFAETLESAHESAHRVLEVEQGYKIVSVKKTDDPREVTK